MLKLIFIYFLCVLVYSVSAKTINICEGKTKSLECTMGEIIIIKSANYGRSNLAVCPDYNIDNNCFASNSKYIVSNNCNNKLKCTISAKSSFLGDPCLGVLKYLTIDYECVKAPPCLTKDQFQCYNGPCIPESLVGNGIRDCINGEDEAGTDYESVYGCDGYTVNINCRRGEIISIVNANYGRLSEKICTNKYMYNTSCKASESLNVLKERCNLKNNCLIPATYQVFGDPCPTTSKYLEVHYRCMKLCTENEFQCFNGDCIDKSKKCDGHWDCPSKEDEHKCDYLTEYACEDNVLTIECKIGSTIKIIGANYGRQLPYICTPQINVNCLSVNSKQIVQNRCDGNRKCSIEARNAQFGDPCLRIRKYLVVNYKCVDQLVMQTRRDISRISPRLLSKFLVASRRNC